jgi:hypothetical protein
MANLVWLLLITSGPVPPPPAPVQADEVAAFVKLEDCKVAGHAIAAQRPGSTFKCILSGGRAISP